MERHSHVLWIARHEDINLELTGKLPPCWLAFTGLEGALQVTGGDLPWSYRALGHATILTCQSTRVHRCNRIMTILRVSSCFLVGFEDCSKEGMYTCCCKPDQNRMAGEIIGPRAESTLAFLKGLVVELSSKYL